MQFRWKKPHKSAANEHELTRIRDGRFVRKNGAHEPGSWREIAGCFWLHVADLLGISSVIKILLSGFEPVFSLAGEEPEIRRDRPRAAASILRARESCIS